MRVLRQRVNQPRLIHLALKSELTKLRKAIQAVSEASVPALQVYHVMYVVFNYVCICIIMYVNRISKTDGKWGN